MNMIHSYGRSVASNSNEPRFGADRAAPLQGADIGIPPRSGQLKIPIDDLYPMDRSTRESDTCGMGSMRPEVEGPVL